MFWSEIVLNSFFQIAILCQANSIRDVIAFPKTGDGKDLMGDAPAAIRDNDKLFYHLK
jgi:aspartyl-tRNA synthetase